MRKYGWVAAFVAMSLLAGCGKSDDASKDKASKNNGGSAEVADAGADPSGDGQISCPPQITPASGPDVVGIHLGVARGEALAIAQCHNQAAKVKFENDWLNLNTHAIKLNPQLFRLTSGTPKVCRERDIECRFGGKEWDRIDEEITVAAPGVPGRETVAGVWRTQNFAEGQQPPVADLIAALTKKYGPPQGRRDFSAAQGYSSPYVQIVWAKDPSGAPMSEQNPNYNNCAFSVNADGEQSQRWSGGCGLSISAIVNANPANPDLAASLKVGMMDQAKAYNYGEAIQQQLDAMDATRRQQELNKAKQSGSNVQL